MMKLKNIAFLMLILVVGLTSCGDDDDNDTGMTFELRDMAEVEAENQADLQAYLETHFYNYEEFENPPEGFDYKIQFDTIAGDNSDKIALINRSELNTRTVERDDFTYTYYVLKVREGEGKQPTFADSTFVTYRGQLLTGESFDGSTQPVWFDLAGTLDPFTGTNVGTVITGFRQGLIEFKTATGFTENPDNTVTFNNDYGIGAVFMPSGIAYFERGPGIIPAYAPLIFTFDMLVYNQADHDGDGIPSILENLDGDDRVFDSDDDTDEDGIPNYLDLNDDNDDEITELEIEVNDENDDNIITEEEINFFDTNNDGIPDYLQVEDGRPDTDN